MRMAIFSFRHGKKESYTTKTKSNVSNTVSKWNVCYRVTPISGKTTSPFIWTEFLLFISEIQLTVHQHPRQEYGVNRAKDSNNHKRIKRSRWWTKASSITGNCSWQRRHFKRTLWKNDWALLLAVHKGSFRFMFCCRRSKKKWATSSCHG